jgi:hypothetical protein
MKPEVSPAVRSSRRAAFELIAAFVLTLSIPGAWYTYDWHRNRVGTVAQDDFPEVSRYTKACDVGDAEDCNRLGYMYDRGTDVQQDTFRASVLYAKSCDDGNAAACSRLLDDLSLDGWSDYSRAVNLYSEACDGGDAHGCGDLGRMYEFGRGVTRDSHRAEALYAKSCDRGDTYGGCASLRRLSAASSTPPAQHPNNGRSDWQVGQEPGHYSGESSVAVNCDSEYGYTVHQNGNLTCDKKPVDVRIVP